MLKTPPLGLYIHIPWCVRKCPYCDFNSHKVEEALPEGDYIAALLADLEGELPGVEGRELASVFIGGGTPSLFRPDSIADLLAGVAERLPLAADAEITLEANPGTAESGKFRDFRAAGVNRLSIGVQSLNDGHLQRLGRIHDGREAIRAAEMAITAGFENFNLDLMFGLPEQTPEDALTDIRGALALNPAHLSFYQLTLEPNTLFHKYPPPLPGDDTLWRMQGACQALLEKDGFRQYEVSAYAREGYRCRHNLNYWRFGDYLGIGAGAHGKITDAIAGTVTRSWKIRHPQRYLAATNQSERIGACHVVNPLELPVEFLMNHLRLREGFAEPVFSERTGLSLAALEAGLAACRKAALLESSNGVIRCTDKGWNFLDNVLENFLP